MNNFLNFIEEDIEAKKTLISTLPTRTKKNKSAYNDKLENMQKKYEDYKANVRNYIITKSRSFRVKPKNKNIDSLTEKLNNLEHIKFVLNPTNTYFEKLGFDNLLYEISNYNDFNFDFMNQVIEKYLEKFEMVGIHLKSSEFDYTCYVNEYMTTYLKMRNSKKKDDEELSNVFEKIYWLNPELVDHIKLNFRKLIRKYEWKFIGYVNKIQRQIKVENGIKNYEDCLKKLKIAYLELNKNEKEDINDIIDLALNNKIDISQYLEDSKARQSTYSSIILDPEMLKNKSEMADLYYDLGQLKNNLQEYSKYMEVMPIIDNFKEEFEKDIKFDPKTIGKELKNLDKQIITKESQLNKINRKIHKSNKKNDLSPIKIESIRLAKELDDLYKLSDKEYFRTKVLCILSDSITIADLLHIYYSFDYFKKLSIKKVFNIEEYDELMRQSESFDLLAMNPTNIIINGIIVFEESNIARVIANKYRLDKININEDELDEDNVKSLINKIDMMLRIDEIEKSQITVEKIWFMVQVQKLTTETQKVS